VVDPANSSNLYTGTTAGGLFRSINGGASWSIMSPGLRNYEVDSLAIDPASPSRVYLGSNGGGVFQMDVSSVPDYYLSFDQQFIGLHIGAKGSVTLNINRTDGFGGNVTVERLVAAGVIHVKPKRAVTTTDSSITYVLKIDPTASPGAYNLVFNGTDDSGRARSVELLLLVQ